MKQCLMCGNFHSRPRAKFCSKQCVDRSWYLSNREHNISKKKKWRANNKDYARQQSAQWKKDNPAKCCAATAKRKAAKLQAMPPWLTQRHLDEIVATYTEAQRLTLETNIKHHVDHIVPLQGKEVRGLHVPWNLQILKAEDNLKKSNKHGRTK